VPSITFGGVNGGFMLFAALLPVISGKLIDINLMRGLSTDVAYTKAFIVPGISALIALIFAFLSKETKCKNIYNG